MYNRIINLSDLLNKKSFFLFGARATGKSTLIQMQMADAPLIDLLETDTFGRYARKPSLLREVATNFQDIVVIDEIQKVPALLDEVHWLIEKRKMRFLLTGSSARKLKRGGANLLGGRAWTAEIFPLTSAEITDFDLPRYLNHGGIPVIYQSEDYREELISYVNHYLREEIYAEAAVRNLQSFSHFLDLVGPSNGCEMNFESLAKDCGMSPNTIRNYVSILEDTLIAFRLEAFTLTKKRRALTRSKLYFFDIGLANNLSNKGEILPKSTAFGEGFEHFIIMEVRAYNSYRRRNATLTYWRSASGFEVDLIIDKTVAIEIKSTDNVGSKHLKGLEALKEEGVIEKFYCVSLDPEKRMTERGISILPYQQFLKMLWTDQLF